MQPGEIGLTRYIHMSAMGARERCGSRRITETKFGAEQYVRASELDYTIIQPSMIHGPGGFMKQLAGWARGKAFPYLCDALLRRGCFSATRASGECSRFMSRTSPARFLDALEKPATIGNTYETRRCRIDLHLAGVLRRSRRRKLSASRSTAMPIPRWYADLLTFIVPGGWLPFNRSQVINGSRRQHRRQRAARARDFSFSIRVGSRNRVEGVRRSTGVVVTIESKHACVSQAADFARLNESS